MAKTHAQRRRAQYQEELREKISSGRHIEEAIETIKKIDNLANEYNGDNKEEIEIKLKCFDSSLKNRLSLIKKYLPDLQNVQLEGEIETKTILIDLSGEGQEEPEEAK